MHEASTRVDSHSLGESALLLRRDVKDGQTMTGTCRVPSSIIQRSRNKNKSSREPLAQATCLAVPGRWTIANLPRYILA